MQNFPPFTAGFIVLTAFLLQLFVPTAAAQQNVSGAKKMNIGQGQSWDPFNDAALYFSDFDEIHRLERWVFTTGTPVSEQSSSLATNATKSMSVIDVPSPNYCVLRCTPKAELFLYFHAAGDKHTYEAAIRSSSGTLNLWSAQCTVLVVGKNATNATLFSYTKTLNLNQIQPEQLFISNITAYSTNACVSPGTLDHLDISISGYSPSGVTLVDNALRLEVGVKEELKIDSRVIGEECSSTAGRAIVAKGYEYGLPSPGSSTHIVPHTHNTDGSESALTFEWQPSTLCEDDYFPNYQFQLLRLYNTDPTNQNPHVVRCTVDWSRALTLETGSRKQELTLTIPEGEGFYIWRVRPVGNYYDGGITNPRNWGCWSLSYADGEAVNFEVDGDVITAVGKHINFNKFEAPVFYFTQFDQDRNWGYNRSFNETGNDGVHINEGITYTDALLKPMQSQVKVHSAGVVIGSEAVYDHAGRPSLQALPVPILSDGSTYQQDLGYKSGLLLNSDGSPSTYTADDFADAVVSAGVAEQATGPINDYYSNSNSDTRIPNAEGYPFATTSYYRDGRVKEQSGVGVHHRIGDADPHTVRVFYATATNKELTSIFGDEAPIASSVYKTVTLDPNGVATVQYVSKAGQLLAVCLTDAGELPDVLNEDNTIPEGNEGSHLQNLVGERVNVLDVEDEIREGQLLNDHTFRSASTYTFLKPTSIKLTYQLTTKFFQDACMNYCGSCDYEIDVRIVNTVTGEVVYSSLQSTTPTLTIRPNAGTLSACSSSTATPSSLNPYTVVLDAGTYVVERIVRTNIKNLDENEEARQWHVHNALDKIKPLNDILKDLYLVQNGSTSASLSNYNGYRIGHGGVYTYLTTGATVCGQLILPEGDCPTGCPRTTTGTYEFPEFERYMISELEPDGDPGTTASLNTWFRNRDGSDKYPDSELDVFPNYSTYSIPAYTTSAFVSGRRMFDELVWNMLNEKVGTTNVYSCDNLWSAWTAAVAYYKIKRGTGGGVPQDNGQTLDLLELFLEYALSDGASGHTRSSTIVGRRPRAYGTSTTSNEGYLSHAHKYFQYTSDPYSLCQNAVILQDNDTDFESEVNSDPDGPNDGTDWQELYECLKSQESLKYLKDVGIETEGCFPPEFPLVRSGEDFDNARRLDEWYDYIACMKNIVTRQQSVCESKCESMREDFRTSVLDAYGSTPPTLDELECMVDALVKNCEDGCALPFEVSYGDGPSYPETPADWKLTLPTPYQYNAVRRRLGGSFTVKSSPYGQCPAGDPDPYEYAPGSGKTLKSLLAQYLTDYFNEVSRTCTSACTVNFYQKALEFLGSSNCIMSEEAWPGLVEVVVYPGSTGSFVLHEKVGIYDQCCELVFNMSRKVRQEPELQKSVDNLNSMLNSLWGKALVSYNPVDSEKIATNRYLMDIDTSAPSPQYFKHCYYSTWTADPWKDTLALYANKLLHPMLNTPNDGMATFKILSNAGDQDFSSELSGVLASKVTDVFSTSGTWLAYGTIVIQMPRTSYDEPVKKIVARLTREDADKTDLLGIALEVNIGDGSKATNIVSIPVTKTMDEFLKFTSKPFTESVGSFSLSSDKKIIFTTLKDSNYVKVEPFYTIATTASVRFSTACTICQVTSCGICVAWHQVTSPTIELPKPHTFAVLSCEAKQIEKIKDLITEQYTSFVNSTIDDIESLYTSTCVDPSKIDDQLKIEYRDRYYHYTLFYYDRAGNLVRSIQPKGVNLVDANDRTRDDHPAHTFKTQNEYNSSGQALSNTTPDGGKSNVWYNNIGQVRFTQDAVQSLHPDTLRYDYINYDKLGRVVETGEVHPSGSITALLEDNTVRGDKYITQLYYDNPFSLTGPYASDIQRYTNNRLSAITYEESYSASRPAIEKQVNYFSYDEHGNQEWSVSHQPASSAGGTYLATKAEYEYNLVSGTLSKLSYQKGFADRFFQRYTYDVNDRLTGVETSRDDVIWDKDAGYEYYLHGPLKRTTLGEDSVQANDYVYTIGGWLKGINHPSLDPIKDPGGDGNSIATGKTRFAADAFGMMFEYFPDDFDRSSSPFSSTTANASYMSTLDTKPLYDGTIRAWSTNIKPPVQNTGKQLEQLTGYAFRYDVLYRLRSGDFAPYYSGAWHNDADYEEYHEYDANGNNTYLRRWARIAAPLDISAQRKMDEFYNFEYTSGTNRLRHFTESGIAAATYSDDIDSPIPTDNYTYDAAGRITKDCKEGVETTWDAFNRVVQVINYNYNSAVDCSTSFTPNDKSRKVVYHYDAGGRKTIREEYGFNPTNGQFNTAPLKITRYVYGAMGLLGVYEQTETETTDIDDIRLVEWPMYGMSRLGTAVTSATITYSTTATVSDDGLYSRPVSKKLFEITDHLGNVRAVVSDMKLVDGSSFRPDMRSYTNYYPYGLPQPNRCWSAEEYRFGFNGVEKENTTYDNGTAGSGEGKMLAMDFRMYDARLGRWWGQDPIVHPWESPYAAMGNDPVNFADPLGLEGEADPKNEGQPNEAPCSSNMPRSTKHPGDIDNGTSGMGGKNGVPSSSLDIMYIDEKNIIDMGARAADESASSWNANGWARNEKYFWQQWKDTELGKKALSQANLEHIAEGRPARVDQQWLETMPKHAAAELGEVIHHHHIGNGKFATPVPASLHIGKGYYKLLHSKIKKLGKARQKSGFFKRLAGKIKRALHALGWIGDAMELKDIYNNSPDAYNNVVYEEGGAPISGFKVNNIYYYQPTGVYVQLTQYNQYGTVYDVYGSYGIDADGKYIGLDYQFSGYDFTGGVDYDYGYGTFGKGTFNKLKGERPGNEM